MKMAKKLYVCDLDGTLLNKKSALDMVVSSTLNKLIDYGAFITFVTGRDLNSALRIMKKFNKSIPIAAYNGSLIYDSRTERILTASTIDKTMVDAVGKSIKCGKEPIVSGVLRENDGSFREIQGLKINDTLLKNENIEILSIVLKEVKSNALKIFSTLKSRFSKFLNIELYDDPNNPFIYIVDITSIKGTKEKALKYIANLFKINNENVVAFGNSSNDISMLKIAGIACAVGDSEHMLSEYVKVQLPYDEGISVASFIEEDFYKDWSIRAVNENDRMPYYGREKKSILKEIEPAVSSRRAGGTFLGYPQTTPHYIAVKAYNKYLKYNTNQIGVFTNTSNEKSKTRRMEAEVIKMLGSLYGLPEVDGYITSGGTEGNIMGIWIAKNLFQAQGKKVYLIKSNLSHTSIDKACKLCNSIIPIEIELDSKTFNMNVSLIKSKIEEIADSNAAIIVVATEGYTLTGTCDSISEISHMLDEMKEKYGISCCIHVDAAIGGMVFPFCDEEDSKWFNYNHVTSITVDPHKMGYIPYSAGVFLCRKDLLNHIMIECNYSKKHNDRTLIGSRSGAPAVACWSMFQYYGMDGYRKMLKTLVRKKEYMLKKLLDKNLISIVSNPKTNMCCIRFISLPNNLLPKDIEETYATRAFTLNVNGKLKNCYKIYVMPHVTYKVLDGFVDRIENIMKV